MSNSTPNIFRMAGVVILAIVLTCAFFIFASTLFGPTHKTGKAGTGTSQLEPLKPWNVKHIASAKYITIPGDYGPLAVYRNIHDITIEEGTIPRRGWVQSRNSVTTTFYTSKGELIKATSTFPPFILNTRPTGDEAFIAAMQHETQTSVEKAEVLRREADELEGYRP